MTGVNHEPQPVAEESETGSLEPRRGRTAVIAIVVIAVVVAVVAALLANDGEPEAATTSAPELTTTLAPTTAPPTLSNEEIARIFIGATVTGDTGAASALVDTDASVDLAGIANAAEVAAWLEWNRAIGFATDPTDCQSPDPDTVRCEYTYTSAWMTDAAPVAGNSMSFTIENERITNVAETFNFSAFEPAWEAFKAWLGRSSPNGRQQVLTADDTPILTPEALEAWQRYSDEFVASFELVALGDRFLDAFLTFDPSQLESVAGSASDIHDEQYLQAWSVATNYQVTDRRCRATVRQVTCTLEGTDELGIILGLAYIDTFTIAVRDNGSIRTVVWTPESDPAGALENFNSWIWASDPELFQSGGACEGFFSWGPTPGECANAWIAAAPAYLDATAP